jgi:5-(carboxyamino)imidazole ribonucleotide synthase
VWRGLGGVPCVIERRVPLDVELSAIVARSAGGDVVVYPIAENQHRHGILDVTIVPARVDEQLAADAAAVAVAIAGALDYVGVLAVEMFVSDGQLLVNEMAPRPHNSGHWTLDGAHTDQFAQQVRAVTGSALGDPSMTVPAAAMVNLLGDLWFADPGSAPVEPDWPVALAEASAHLHLYGKREARPGRKMGHLTVLGADATAAAELAQSLRQRLRKR